MRRVRNCVLAILLGFCVPFLIWIGAGVALYINRKEARMKKALGNLTCRIDSDCPPGYECINGRCIPAI